MEAADVPVHAPLRAFGQTQLSLWTVTASAAALACGVFAARIAYRLTGSERTDWRRWPAVVAGLFAGGAVLGMTGYAAPDVDRDLRSDGRDTVPGGDRSHLSGRPRLAFAMMLLASLGRPEAWLFAGLYGIWCWSSIRSMRLSW